MPRGGKREGAGRPSGHRNAATAGQIASLSELAREHTETALSVLVQVATSGQSEGARVTAANSILDRAYGKPQQAVDLSNTDGSLAAVDWSRLTAAERRAVLGAIIDNADAEADEG